MGGPTWNFGGGLTYPCHGTAYALELAAAYQSVYHVLPSIIREYYPEVFEFSVCYSVLPLTCSIHHLVFRERHNALFFIATFHSRLVVCGWKPINQVHIEGPVQTIQAASNHPQKANCCSCSYQHWDVTRLRLSMQFILTRTPHKIICFLIVGCSTRDTSLVFSKPNLTPSFLQRLAA